MSRIVLTGIGCVTVVLTGRGGYFCLIIMSELRKNYVIFMSAVCADIMLVSVRFTSSRGCGLRVVMSGSRTGDNDVAVSAAVVASPCLIRRRCAGSGRLNRFHIVSGSRDNLSTGCRIIGSAVCTVRLNAGVGHETIGCAVGGDCNFAVVPLVSEHRDRCIFNMVRIRAANALLESVRIIGRLGNGRPCAPVVTSGINKAVGNNIVFGAVFISALNNRITLIRAGRSNHFCN